MPIYEYQCQACQERMERLQSLSDPPLTTCPACGGELKKLISAPSFQFKGSGWYVTDYARKGDGAKGGKDGDKKDGDKKPEAKEGAAASKDSAKSTPGVEKAAKSAAS